MDRITPDRLVIKVQEGHAVGVWQKEHPLLFAYLWENEERKKEFARFLKQII